jgi:hypothetical protein
MLKRVARFSKLKGSDGGLPDSKMPGCERILYNVIGFQPPKTERGGKQSPVGLKAARMAAIKISEGFNLGYCRAKPGKGPMLHNRRRDVHRHDRYLARDLGERARGPRARRPEAPGRDLLSARGDPPLHERHARTQEQVLDPDVRDRRQRAELGIHQQVDARNRSGGRDAGTQQAETEAAALAPMQEQIRFCSSSDGTRLAYAVSGEGPPLIKAQSSGHLEHELEQPGLAALADCRSAGDSTWCASTSAAAGLSDADVADISFEAWVEDLEAVVDASG